MAAERKRYQCDACGHEFNSYLFPKLCPYCGKEKTVKPVKSVNDILNEISAE